MSAATSPMKRVYVPGYARAKAALAVIGFGVALAGTVELAGPLRAVLAGRTAIGEIAAIVTERPGFPTEFQRIPRRFEEDQERRITYGYQVLAEEGTEPLLLNVKNRVAPVYEVGAGLRIAWSERAEIAYAVWNLATWAPGAFLLFAGLVFGGAFAHLFLRCRQPIPLPEDTPAGHAPE